MFIRKKYPVKVLKDGRAMLNLGCGTKMNWDWNNIDFSPYARLSHHRTIAKILKWTGLLSEERYQILLGISPEIIYWDLRKGIPFRDESFDVVYNSHFLEHIDRDAAPSFLKECYRVLKMGGIIRIVVPDLQTLINNYVLAISELESGNEQSLDTHRQAIYNIFDQMVPQEPLGTKKQRPLVRTIEKFFRGDTSRIGVLHRWMYDKYHLGSILTDVGFKNITVETLFTSRIEGWNQFDLDINNDGTVYKLGSLYMEGVKQPLR